MPKTLSWCGFQARSSCQLPKKSIKDNNIVQAMTQSQSKAVDLWTYYQSKSTKQNIAENFKLHLELEKNKIEIELKANNAINIRQIELLNRYAEKNMDLISEFQKKVDKYETEKSDIKKQAEEQEVLYNKLNVHDDQFDLAEVLLSLGLSLFGISSLLQNKYLFAFGCCISMLGMFFGIAGFLELNVHPEWLTSFLG